MIVPVTQMKFTTMDASQILLFLKLISIPATFAAVIIEDNDVINDCSREINSRIEKEGTIVSPRYPFAYPPNKTCVFSFTGEINERVQLDFLHIDMYYPSGDADDPFDCENVDRIEINIIERNRSKAIGIYCGRKQPPMLMSADHRLQVVFISTPSPTQTSGFIIQYKFRKDFGIETGEQDFSVAAECVFHFYKNSSSDVFTSPNFPGLYPQKTECHYMFHAEHNQTVHVEFLFFDVEGIPPSCSEETQSDWVTFSNYNIGINDRRYSHLCGTVSDKKKKKVANSDGNFFRVTFHSNDVYDATGFKAVYEFRDKEEFDSQTDEQEELPEGACVFNFRKEFGSTGVFMSPDYPRKYPHNTECHYLFHAGKGERVKIEFYKFDIDGIPPRCSESSDSDWVEVSNCNIGLADPRLGRFCGTMGEGEILAFNSQGRFLRVTFKSNGVYNGLGFNATYEFGKYYSNVDMILI